MDPPPPLSAALGQVGAEGSCVWVGGGARGGLEDSRRGGGGRGEGLVWQSPRPLPHSSTGLLGRAMRSSKTHRIRFRRGWRG